MAIFRAGKRIGNFDIRVGLPRDKSLDDVEGDKRLKEKFISGNRSVSSINRFMSAISKGEGIARANRFLVRFFPPKFKVKIDKDIDHLETADYQGSTGKYGSNYHMDEMNRNVELFCSKATLPSRDIKSENVVTYGPGRQMPQAYHFNSKIECTFMGDKYLRQRAFFEEWQNLMFNSKTHDLTYYDSYIGSMDIYQLGMYKEDKETPENRAGMSDNLRITYAIRLHEVYPETIGEVQYQALTDDMIPMEMPISFAFRTWENLTLDQMGKSNIGKTEAGMPHTTTDSTKGLMGMISKLPPELRRAGRDIANKIRRDIPIGRATGGRVFPPYGKSFPPFF